MYSDRQEVEVNNKGKRKQETSEEKHDKRKKEAGGLSACPMDAIGNIFRFLEFKDQFSLCLAANKEEEIKKSGMFGGFLLKQRMVSLAGPLFFDYEHRHSIMDWNYWGTSHKEILDYDKEGLVSYFMCFYIMSGTKGFYETMILLNSLMISGVSFEDISKRLDDKLKYLIKKGSESSWKEGWKERKVCMLNVLGSSGKNGKSTLFVEGPCGKSFYIDPFGAESLYTSPYCTRLGLSPYF